MNLNRHRKSVVLVGFLALIGGLASCSRRHLYICLYPREAVADAVSRSEGAFLLAACQSRFLPYRVRREAVQGVIELQGTSQTRVFLSNRQADWISDRFSGDVARESLVFLHPALVEGEINLRIRTILLDATEPETVRWSALMVLLQEPSLITGTPFRLRDLLGGSGSGLDF